jgi:CxxC-x17-CxxC domain-containing protein
MANFPKRDFNSGKSRDFKPSRERSFEGRDRGGRDDKKSFGSSDFKKKSFGGDWNKGGSRDEVTMHKAVCGECGNNCEVPFRPSQDKPVFCRDCFSVKREGPAERNPNKRNYVERDRKESVSPSFSAPVPAMSEDVKRKFEMLTVKIDNLSYIVEKMIEEKKNEVKVVAPVAVEKSVPAKKEVVKKIEIKKVSVAAPVKVAAAKAPAKKVVAKVATKTVAVKAVVTKKVVAKSTPAKTVVAKVVAKKAVAKVVTKVVAKTVTKK